MADTELAHKRCVPCEGGVPPMDDTTADALLTELDGWRRDGDRIVRDDVLPGFRAAVAWIDAVAAVAESQGHHPDLLLHDFNKVRVTLWTHAVGGLSENDFIVAARIDRLRDLLHD